ncbi:helix-turn-helix domain-containing protein [Microbispora cellulosiformans]|uniref:Helix-turn-helix domain-containing protein n=1 Tax=Microbispora cellulosiformans TaxID=2614688 RepID=A0A5J5JXS1_9ACTN|nr:helix-turn-helix domain-containing protein [Microbispora cellulosiformans]KAA9376471.1 helix-turn-helix domain-containing protein [Microbispora cellulosiformans]
MAQDAAGPDPGRIRDREGFARELTMLRERAGLTVRQVAMRAGTPGAHSTIGDWFAGRGLPSLALRELFERVLTVCGAAEVAAWVDAWQRVRRGRSRRRAGVEPYRGLAGFEAEHAAWFFGRDALTERLLRAVTELDGTEADGTEPGGTELGGDQPDGGGLLLVIGASGAGKSSLLRAGLVAALRERGRAVTVCTPASRPVIAARPGEVLIVDQFEEIFTASRELASREPASREPEQAAFVDALVRAAAGGAVVVIGLRADFYGHLLRFPALAAAAQHGQVPVGPMTRDELRDAIVEPARKAGLAVEDALVELLLREAGRAHDAGVLPLLSHALYATWLNDQGHGLTVAGYQEAGGIEGAVAASATEIYEELSPERRELARRLFLHLVHVSADAADTRRRVSSADLPSPGPAMTEVLHRFADQRLLTLDQDTVEITHEALLSAWPLLADWLAADRAALLLGRRFAADAQAWRHERSDPDALYRGARLLAAQEWAQRHPSDVTPTMADFLRASGRQVRRRTRRLYQTIAALVALVVVAAVAAVTASQAQRTAVRQRDQALSRRLAGDAIALRGTNPALSAQLGLAAYRLADTPEARGSVLSASAVPYATRLTAHRAPAYATAFTPGGRILATAGLDRTVRLWNVSDPHRPAPLAVVDASDGVMSAAFRPDGRILATSGADHTVRLWDVADARRPRPLAVLRGHTDAVRTVAFDPRGRLLATASYDRTAGLWDVSDPGRAVRIATLTGYSEGLTSAVFSPDHDVLVTTSADAAVRVWDVGDPRHPRALPSLKGHTDRVLCAAFTSDGRLLATGGFDNTIRLWDLRHPDRPRPVGVLTGHQNGIVSLAFAPGGRTLASGSYDRTARVWDVTDPAFPSEPLVLSGHADVVYSVAFSPDGRSLATAGKDTTVRVWDLRTSVLSGHSSPVQSLAASPDGRLLVAGGYRTARVWDVVAPGGPVPLSTLTGHTDNITAAAFHPGGRLLATGGQDRTVRLWDLSDPRRPRSLAVQAHHEANVTSVAFGPGGDLLAGASADGTIDLWRVADPRRPAHLTTLGGGNGSVDAIAFVRSSRDGLLLAGAGADGVIRLWQVADTPDRSDPRDPPDRSDPRDPAVLRGQTGAVTRLAVSPDGRTLAGAGLDGSVRLWDLTNGPRDARVVATLTGHADAVTGAAFSPDGHTLATGSLDGSIRLWVVDNPRDVRVVATLTGHDGRVQTLTYIPGGRAVATGGEDTTVRLWDVDAGHAARRICALAHPPVTPAEWAAYLPSDLPFRPPC